MLFTYTTCYLVLEECSNGIPLFNLFLNVSYSYIKKRVLEQVLMYRNIWPKLKAAGSCKQNLILPMVGRIHDSKKLK